MDMLTGENSTYFEFFILVGDSKPVVGLPRPPCTPTDVAVIPAQPCAVLVSCLNSQCRAAKLITCRCCAAEL